ncbi:ribonuclease VapC9 [Glycocaulis albus]|uniref:Ribonuclease VapC n=1 Tax=Glycocaulis albus TaxID=1382801 RepID=A0ABQ1XYT0_9PROT|nr:type II toxin-antitoxin system VapC family toxin [Glycocaulis albus]MBV5260410.1 type II toxin-antitoxin system VapC family toxin [Synechococcus moorigangaii CMS01]GGH06841.1 ribonuclease VapC9 [Glycocaulis albus]
MIVDASALLEVLLRSPAASQLEALMFESGTSLHAPHLIDVEAAQVIRKFALSGKISASVGADALADLAGFPLRRYPHDFLLPRIWELRHAISAYGASYVALAEVLDMPLLTRDARLAASASDLVAVIS